MGISLGALTVQVGANIARFHSEMGRASKIANKRGGEIKRSLTGAANSLSTALGTGLGLAGFVAVAGKATTASMEFSEAIAEVSTLLDDTSPMAKMTQATKDLARQFGTAPVEQVKALYQAISGGAKAGAEATELLTQANKLAVAGVTDVKTAVDALVIVTNAYGDSAGSAADISDVLFTAVKAGRTTISELSQGIGIVATLAGQMGISFKETAAAAATFTKAGVGTNEAMTALRGVLVAIAKPSEKAVKTAKELGLEFNTTALASKGLTGFLESVKKATGGNIETMTKLFGRVEGLGLVLNLTGKGAEDFANILLDMANSAGITDKAYAKMADSFAVKTRKFKAIIEVAFISIGDKILKYLVPAMEFLVKNATILGRAITALALIFTGKLVISMVATIAQTIKLQLALASMSGVSKLSALSLLALDKATKALKASMSLVGGPIGLLVIALGSLAVYAKGVKDEFDKVKDESKRLAGSLSDVVTALKDVTNVDQAVFQLERLQSQFEHNSDAIDANLELLDALARQGITTGMQVEALTGNITRLTEDTIAVEKAMNDAKNKIIEFDNSAADATKTAEELAEEQEQLAAAARKLAEEQEAAAEEARRLEEAEAALTAEIEAQKVEVERLNAVYRDMQKELDPLIEKGEVFMNKLDAITNQVQQGNLSWSEYINWLVKIRDEYNKSGEAAEDMADQTETSLTGMGAIIENTFKRLDDTFANFWQTLFKDGKFSLTALKDMFLDVLAQMAHAAITQPIVMKIGAIFAGTGVAGTATAGTGTGSLGGLSSSISGFFDNIQAFFGGNTSQTGLARYFGTDSPGSGTFGGAAAGAFTGFAIGSMGVFGGSNSESAGGAIGGAIGSIWGPIGSFVGSILGSFVGSLFARDPRIQGGGADATGKVTKKGLNTSALGGFFLGNGAGGVGEFRMDAIKAIQDFDEAIASFLNNDQLSKITNALKSWDVTLRKEAVSLENLLESRFAIILGTFSSHVQDYVNTFDGIEDQTEALAKYVSALNSVSFALSAFINSNPAQEVADALSTPLLNSVELLSSLGDELTDAFDNFDNTPEQLNNISNLIEERYLAEFEFLKAIAVLIDGITKSIEAQQQSIRDTVAGPTPDKTFSELMTEAQLLMLSLGDAGSPEEIANIVKTIQSLIDQAFKGLDPAGQAAQADFLIEFLDQVAQAATAQAEALAAQVIADGESLREQAILFADAFAIPLDLTTAAVDNVEAAVTSQTEILVEQHQIGHEGRSEIVAALDALINKIDEGGSGRSGGFTSG